MMGRKGCQSLPSSMMETSIDEGIETEGECEEDSAHAFAALQATRCGKRRHTLSEVTNQLVVVPGTGTGMGTSIQCRGHAGEASKGQLAICYIFMSIILFVAYLQWRAGAKKKKRGGARGSSLCGEK